VEKHAVVDIQLASLGHMSEDAPVLI
jgi:hypothetical protein